MSFNSLTFVCLFCFVMAVQYSRLPWNTKKATLLICSYLFYAAWNPPFVLLLWLSTGIDWYMARFIATTTRQSVRRICLAISLAVNLGLLGFFKYSGFALQSFCDALQLVGFSFQPLELDIVLPVGISFYTFQTLSYTLDIYRGTANPHKSFLDFALYVTFFPQLVAGPIVRSTDFLPQCEIPRARDTAKIGWGLNLVLIGLFEKTILADGLCAPVVEKAYGVEAIDLVGAWTGTLAFAGQIFFDFNGYSLTAIGISLCLGFTIPDNFRFPYAAIGFSDFWRRWHISLSSWLRDYLYIALGGNRGGTSRTFINLMLTMLLGGLWHGASWSFVIWGAMHGTFLGIERWLSSTPLYRWPIWQARSGRMLLGLLTFVLVCFTWVFFRATSLSQAISLTLTMLGLTHSDTSVFDSYTSLVIAALIGGLLLGHALCRRQSLEAIADRMGPILWGALCLLMILLLLVCRGDERAFIYFQF